MMVACLAGAVVFLFFGVVTLFRNRENMARRQRILATPTTRVADAAGNGPAKIRGRIVPSEEGLITAPFSHRPAVWARVTVKQLVRSGKSTYWKTLHKEEACRPFWIDDGSRQMARIVPDGAELNVAVERVGTSNILRDAHPRVETFLQMRHLSSSTTLGFNKTMAYTEEILRPSERVYALGPSRRDPISTSSGKDDMVGSTMLVMFPRFDPPGGTNELILSSKDERKLVASLQNGTIAGVVCIGVAVALAITGAVLANP